MMKKILAFIITLCLLLAMIPAMAVSTSAAAAAFNVVKYENDTIKIHSNAQEAENDDDIIQFCTNGIDRQGQISIKSGDTYTLNIGDNNKMAIICKEENGQYLYKVYANGASHTGDNTYYAPSDNGKATLSALLKNYAFVYVLGVAYPFGEIKSADDQFTLEERTIVSKNGAYQVAYTEFGEETIPANYCIIYAKDGENKYQYIYSNSDWVNCTESKTLAELLADYTKVYVLANFAKDPCEYEAALGELTAEAGAKDLYLNGNPIAGVQVKKLGNNYYLVDAEGKAVTVDGYTSWQYDAKTGALYNSKTEQTSVLFFFNWNFSHGGTKTTKYYLNADANDKLFVSCKPQVARYPEVGEHEWAYTVNEDDTHTATCKHCNKVCDAEQHTYTDDACVCGKLNPTTCKITAVKVKDVNTVLTSPLWLFKRLFFIARNTYTYQISATGTQVKAAKVETSVNGEEGTWKTGVLLTSDLKLNELYIRITDTNGEVSNWYWDGEKVEQIVEYAITYVEETSGDIISDISTLPSKIKSGETLVFAMTLDTNKFPEFIINGERLGIVGESEIGYGFANENGKAYYRKDGDTATIITLKDIKGDLTIKTFES